MYAVCTWEGQGVCRNKDKRFMSEKTQSTMNRMLTESVSLSWPHMPRLILALSQTPVCQVNTVPSVITSERDTKEDLNVSQSISRDPLSVVLHDLIPKPCLRKHTYLPILCWPKEKRILQCFKCIYPDVTKHKQRLSNWRSPLCRSSLQRTPIYLLIYWVSGDWSTCATDSLCLLSTDSVLSAHR